MYISHQIDEYGCSFCYIIMAAWNAINTINMWLWGVDISLSLKVCLSKIIVGYNLQPEKWTCSYEATYSEVTFWKQKATFYWVYAECKTFPYGLTITNVMTRHIMLTGITWGGVSAFSCGALQGISDPASNNARKRVTHAPDHVKQIATHPFTV